MSLWIEDFKLGQQISVILYMYINYEAEDFSFIVN